MLLRIRWQLLQSDYSSALTLLLRYPALQNKAPQSLVHDALYLEQNLSPARGAFLISKYSGRPPEIPQLPLPQRSRGAPSKKNHLRGDSRNESQDNSPGQSPARNNQRSLEALFQDVSEGLQRRTEHWGVAKVVRGAVTEARRNMANVEAGGIPSLRPWHSSPRPEIPSFRRPGDTDPGTTITQGALEKGNSGLAQLLQDALSDLDVVKEASSSLEPRIAEALRRAFEKIQTAQTRLHSPHIQWAAASTKDDDTISKGEETPGVDEKPRAHSPPAPPARGNPSETEVSNIAAQRPCVVNESGGDATAAEPPATSSLPVRIVAPSSTARPPLADSEFSWMLGENTHRYHFVSSASLPPDQRRHSESRPRQSPLFGDARDDTRPRSTDEEDGLPLKSLT